MSGLDLKALSVKPQPYQPFCLARADFTRGISSIGDCGMYGYRYTLASRFARWQTSHIAGEIAEVVDRVRR